MLIATTWSAGAKLEEEVKKFKFYGPFILFRTKRFQAVLDSLGRRRISKPVAWFLLFLMPIAAAIGFYLFLTELSILLSPRGPGVVSFIRSLGPQANIGLPVLNPYLPVVYTVIAIAVGVIVHEGAHGVIARSLGLPVKSSGLILFLIIPIGAFVDVDETALKEAKNSQAGRVLAGGAGMNMVLGVVSLLLLILVVSTMAPASSQGVGVIVVQDSPISQAGIQTHDFILAVNGIPLNDVSSIGSSSWYKINNTVTITVWRDGTTFTRNVTIGTQVFENVSSGQKFYYPFLGISLGSPSSQGVADFQSLVSTYTGSALTRPLLYTCIPTLCQAIVPFSDDMSGFYSSPLGVALVPLANLLYWIFFLNLNLAVFNSMPILPLDGGLAFRVAVKALGRDKLSERTLGIISGAATFATVALLFVVIVGPYLLFAAG